MHVPGRMTGRYVEGAKFGLFPGVAWLLLLVPGLWQETEVRAAEPDQARDSAAKDELPVDPVLAAMIDDYLAAYNAADASAVAACFLERAEYLDDTGMKVRGRAAIEKGVAEFFQAHPAAQISVPSKSIRMLSSELAVEDGLAKVTGTKGEPVSSIVYSILYTRIGGKEGHGETWKIVSMHDHTVIEQPSPHQRLKPLAWLVGEWVVESAAGPMQCECRWSDDGSYLLQEYHGMVDGKMVRRISQRIGWQARLGKIKSWSFAADGGLGEALWTWETSPQRWNLQFTGVHGDGRIARATHYLTPMDDDSYRLESTGQSLEEEPLPDQEVLVVRRAPEIK